MALVPQPDFAFSFPRRLMLDDPNLLVCPLEDTFPNISSLGVTLEMLNMAPRSHPRPHSLASCFCGIFPISRARTTNRLGAGPT
jgi:hypothetical protein